MDKNQGYSILKTIMLENGRGFALGHSPTAPSPYVTWACYDDDKGQRQYEWGHYGNDLGKLEKDLVNRVTEYQRLYKVKIAQTEAFTSIIPPSARWTSGRFPNRPTMPQMKSSIMRGAFGWRMIPGWPGAI